MKKLIIQIDNEANATVKIGGCSGSSCKQETAEIEKALGSTTHDVLTPEYHQQATQERKQQQ